MKGIAEELLSHGPIPRTLWRRFILLFRRTSPLDRIFAAAGQESIQDQVDAETATQKLVSEQGWDSR